MLNAVWVLLIVGALVCGALAGNLQEVANASAHSAKKAVELVIGLIGVMAFWLGLMRVLQRAGLVRTLTRWGRPLLVRLFPDVPPEHPAMGMILMNMSANVLGLGNAATPFGLKAMVELDKLNTKKGVATNAMALFLAINTSHLAILPTGIIALRTSLGSHSPGAIIATTLLATACSTMTAVLFAKLLCGLPIFAADRYSATDAEAREVDLPVAPEEATPPAPPAWMRIAIVFLATASGLSLVYAMSRLVEADGDLVSALDTAVTQWTLVVLIVAFVLYGAFRGVKVFDCVVDGAKEAFQIAVKLVPYFIALMVAIGMFRASGAIDLMVRALRPITAAVGFPPEALPMALLRPFSGKAAFAVAAETMEAHGADSMIGFVVSTMQGSTDTTFYVVALYFGVVAVRHVRHTILACLAADIVGALGAAWFCAWLLA
ncbi:MAG: spore maturation protein [Deltaproteobacteria bacterium]